MLTTDEERLLIDKFQAWQLIYRPGIAKLYSANAGVFQDWLRDRPVGGVFQRQVDAGIECAAQARVHCEPGSQTPPLSAQG